MSNRDRVRQTYQAEWATFTSDKVNARQPLKDARATVHKYLPGWIVEIRHTGSRAWCYCDERVIELGQTSPSWIVCHEIAHGLVHKAGAPPGHHDAFRHFYVSVVRNELGPYWANKLIGQFKHRGLGMRHPKEKRTPKLLVIVLRLLGRL